MIPGRGAAASCLLLLLVYPLHAYPSNDLVIQPSNNVGCVFSEQVCPQDEICFDDGVLGRCVSAAENNQHLYRNGPISSQDLHMLAAEMKRVLSQGYTWDDDYSQCILQSLVDHINHDSDYNPDACNHLLDGEDTGTLDDDRSTLDDDTSNQLDPAYQLTPQQDEENEQADTDFQYAPYSADFDPTDLQFPEIIPLEPEMDPDDSMTMPDPVLLADLPTRHLAQVPHEYLAIDPPNYVFLDPEDDGDDVPDRMPKISDMFPVHYVPEDDDDAVGDVVDDADVESPHLIRSERTKRRSSDWTVLKEPQLDEHQYSEPNYDFDYTESEQLDDEGGSDAVYYSTEAKFPLETVFDRRERLDVKKPGPFYTNSQNNFFIDKILRGEYMEAQANPDNANTGQTEHEFPLLTKEKQKKSSWGGDEIFSLGFEGTPSEQPSYLVVHVKDRLRTLSQATSILQAVADQLHLPLQTFGERKLGPNRMSVEVHDNPAQLNASTIAEKLSDQVDQVNAKIPAGLNIQVAAFSSGSQFDVTSVFTGHSRLFLALFLLTAGISSALVVAGLVLILRRRRASKIGKEIKDEVKSQPVKEYKQLVRDWSRSSRASQSSATPPTTTTTQQEGEEAAAKVKAEERAEPKQPLAGVPAKTQNTEGSRTSSTSSWNEELGVSTMDISTGHMVLNYMEDHLKNAQRLEQEWVGLCAYEAEPSATTVAFKVENRKKNRYPDKLPYDHNRVLLNALVNHDNSDYINASTVTDHDPRNPGYIVTQGPLADTVPDFWQMVWEQGSVVIVMLSRLSENGYQLVHRYWPEEGSQTYHIYEVHLVSEHVWCDDYLVRSLYLKNTQTGETRTVTQFHFLAWPDRALPESTKSLLEFRRKVNKSYRGRSCPIIVHCSDGVGRSGSYVLLDMVLNKMNKGSKEIDIAATLEHIRDQRTGMVQTKSQFEFCLTAVAEETHAVLKSLAAQ